jgi:hypothetical protein
MERLSLESMSAAAGVLVKQADDAWTKAHPVRPSAMPKPLERDSHIPTPEELIEDRRLWAEAEELERSQREALNAKAKALNDERNKTLPSLEEELASLGTYVAPTRRAPNSVADQLRESINNWPETTKPSEALTKPVKDWE